MYPLRTSRCSRSEHAEDVAGCQRSHQVVFPDGPRRDGAPVHEDLSAAELYQRLRTVRLLSIRARVRKEDLLRRMARLRGWPLYQHRSQFIIARRPPSNDARRPSAPRRPTAPIRSSSPACSARSGRPTRKVRSPGAAAAPACPSNGRSRASRSSVSPASTSARSARSPNSSSDLRLRTSCSSLGLRPPVPRLLIEGHRNL